MDLIVVEKSGIVHNKRVTNNTLVHTGKYCNNDFLYTTYVEDTTVFYIMENLQQKSSITLTLRLNFLLFNLTNQNLKYQELESRKG